MKVTLDVSAVPARPAGAGRYIVEMARRLPFAGTELTLITRRHDTARWRALRSARTIVADVPDARVARLAYESVVLGRTRAARESDIWHSPHYTMPRGLRAPAVVTIHDMTFFTNPEWHERSKVLFFRRAIERASRRANALIAVSEFTANQLREICPSDVPVVVAPLGVDHERFNVEDQADAAIVGGSRAQYVLFVGTLEPRKGVDVLLRAFDNIADDHDGLELWIAGQIGWANEDVEALLGSLRSKDRVRRLGYVSDVDLVTLLQHARVVAYPSRGEGFGLPVLEAMACGALVITTRGTVMAEVAGDGAQLVTPGDVDELASALDASLVMDDLARAAASSRARARAQAFTWERCVAQHLVAYKLAVG